MDNSTQASPQPGVFFTRFTDYFKRPVAEQAAKTLADGAQIELRVQGSDGTRFETILFSRENNLNIVHAGASSHPHVIFTLTPLAADEILNQTYEDVGSTGIQIVKLIFSADANRRVGIKIRVGFFDLWEKGYFGVLGAGGTELAKILASKGLDGVMAIRSAIKKATKDE